MKLTLQCNAAILKTFLAFVVCCFISLSGFSQTVSCPPITGLGTFDCTTIGVDFSEVPDSPSTPEEAMAAPYNIGIDGVTSTTRVHVEDSGSIFYCEENDRVVTRMITIYDDANFNFIYDAGEEIADCNFTINTVADVIAPQFAAPSEFIANCVDGYDPDVAGDVTVVSDDECPVYNVSEYVFFADAVADGRCMGELIVTRSWTAVDPCGNTSEPQTQMIVVMDTEGPVFTVPPDIELDCSVTLDDLNADPSLTGMVTDAMDLCDPSEITVNSVIIPDLIQENTPCPGATTYTKRWAAIDDCGNPTTLDQMIVTTDTTPPDFDVPGDVDLACGDTVPAAADIDAVDDCDPNGLVATFVGEDISPAGALDCEARTIVRTWTAVDGCGNETTKTQTINFPACEPVCNDDPCVGDITEVGAGGCSCDVVEEQVLGCTDDTACNFDPAANCDDGSCMEVPVCNDDPCVGDITGLSDDGCSCELVEEQVLGCTDDTACNYDPAANCDDDSCMPVPVCNDDPCVGDVTALSADECSCELVEEQVLGCQDPAAHNYNEDANCPTDDCTYFDLALEKDLITPAPITAGTGTVLTFLITVINEGDVTATDIIVHDHPPAGLILADSNWTDNGSFSTTTIPGPLLPGESTGVEVSYELGPDIGPGSYMNIAEIGGASDGDGNPVDDIDSDPDDDPNNDPEDEDDIDDEVWEIVCATPTCNDDPCEGDITELSADGCSCDVVEPQVIGCQDDTAHNYEPGANCAADCEYFDLALIKVLTSPTGPITIDPNTMITFTHTVYNQGDVTATNIVVNDFYPTGLILNDSNWSDSGGVATITIPGPLAPGDEIDVDITFTLDPDVTPGSLTNIAEIESAQDGDGNPTNDVDSTPDDDPNNDPTVDNEIDNGGGDEDDNDPETIELVCETPVCNDDPCEGDVTELSDDGCSCVLVEEQVLGCTDPDAQNYDPDANCDDGCIFCINDAGEQSDGPTIGLCYGETTTVTTTDPVVQDGSTLTYYLHDGTGSTIYDISSSGTFTNNYDNDDIYNVTLYISAGVGPIGPDGNPDLTEDCIDLNLPGTPVILYAPIEFDVKINCDTSVGMYSVSFTITGGAPSATGGSYQVTGVYNGTANAGQQNVVTGLADGSLYFIEVIDDGSGCTGSIGDGPIACVKLPIELISYTGEVLSEGNILKWRTASEINNDYFTLERATPGSDYKVIASSIKGNGTTSTPKSYEFFDREAPNGVAVYRLWQTDFDGTKNEVGKVELIRGELSSVQFVNVSPIPIHDNVELLISSEENQSIQLQILNSLGKLMLDQQVDLDAAINKVDLDLGSFASGVYVISLVEGENVTSTKVLKH